MIKVLLVDDVKLIRRGIRAILDLEPGIEVVGEAMSGEDALKSARQLKPDVVLMDIKMPGIGGLEATRKLLQSCPEIKVLILTVCDSISYPERLLQLGASGYITKSIAQQEMIRAIKSVHSGQRHISSDIANRLVMKHISGKHESPFDLLSEREFQIVLMIAQGMKVQKIAGDLHLSPKTVNSYRYRTFEKLSVKNDVEMTLLAIQYGLIESHKDHFVD